MNWNEIKITTSTEAVEAISYELTELNIKGIEIIDPKDILMQDKDSTEWDYIEEDLISNLNKDEVIIKCYVSEEEDLNSYVEQINKKLTDIKQFLPIGKGLIEVKNVKEEQWAHTWKKYFKPIRVGQHMVIKPTWENYNEMKPGDTIIEIDPGMAFGTGTHETTSMCIELIEKYLKSSDSVLDIGCGSGILSIAAALLGSVDVTGVDIDPNAVRVAKENVNYNKVHNYVKILQGNLLDVVDKKANMIVANIIADVIISMANIVPKFLSEDGIFIASGIIDDRLYDVQKALDSVGLIPIEQKTKGEWAALVYKKKA